MATFVPNVTDIYPEPALYRPDFSFLDTMLRRRQAMYNQGFAEISSKYSALAKNLTNPYNSQVRNQFLTEAQNQLKNLSAMDLSQQQNVSAAADVFTPLYKDSNVMADLALTSHWDQQEKIAESFRLKDGGKEYSEANLEYVRMQRQDFAKDKPESAGMYLGSKRYYSPYRDYSKKFMEAYEKFKPSVEDIEYVDGQYIRGKRDASIKSAEFRKYLENVLSPEEKRQIEIEGIVKYGKTPEALLGMYSQKVENETKGLDANIEYWNGQAKLAKTDQEKSIVKQNIDYYTDRKSSLMDSYEKLSSMDRGSLMQVKDRVAADLYYEDVIGGMAKSAERKDIKTTVQANSVWTTIYSNQQQWARQKDSQNFEWNKMLKQAEIDAQKESNKKAASGAFTGSNVTLKASEETAYGMKGLESDIAGAQQAIDAAGQRIASHLIATNQSADANTVKSFIDKYAKISNNVEPVLDKTGRLVGHRYRDSKKPVEPVVEADLQAFSQWSSAVGPQQMKLNSLTTYKKQLEDEVVKRGAPEYAKITEKLNNILPGKKLIISTDGGKVQLTPKQLYDGLADGSIKRETKGVVSGGSGAVGGPGVIPEFWLNINGKKVKANNSPVLMQVMNSIGEIERSKESKSIQGIRENVYSSSFIGNNTMALFDQNSDFYKDKKGEVEQILGKEVVIRGGDLLSGRLAISLKENDKATTEDVLKAVGGRADITYDETNDMFFIKNLKGMDVLSNYSPAQQAIYQSASTPVKGKQESPGVYSLESAPFRIGNLPYDFKWKRITREYPGTDGTRMLDYEYYIYDGNNPTRPLPIQVMRDPMQLAEIVGQMGNNPAKTVDIVESLK